MRELLLEMISVNRELYTCTFEDGDAFLRIGKFVILQVYDNSSYTIDDDFKPFLNEWQPGYRYPENITEELKEYILANDDIGASINAKFRDLHHMDIGIL
jgi:hypothetical protein